VHGVRLNSSQATRLLFSKLLPIGRQRLNYPPKQFAHAAALPVRTRAIALRNEGRRWWMQLPIPRDVMPKHNRNVTE